MRHRPRITLKFAKKISQTHVTLVNRLKKPEKEEKRIQIKFFLTRQQSKSSRHPKTPEYWTF